MKAVAALLVSLVLPLTTEAPVAKAQQPISRTATQSAPPGITMVLAQGQLPSIDRPVETNHDTAVATRRNGHFFFDTRINGVNVHMLFDTGARFVSLRPEDAERVGINVNSLNYTVRLLSANGIVAAAPVVIREMKVGGITRTNVPAVVGKPGELMMNLLGQTFNSTMAGFSTEGDKLTLRGD